MPETSDVESKHLPRAEERRSGMGLCLSGGGFRAALFHLGALRRLNELGILSQMDAISSVSGGSIISAHLAARVRPWPEAGQVFADWESKVAVPFREFVSHDIRTGPILKRLLPWNWFRTTTQVMALAARYQTDLIRLTLKELPERPRFIFCATDLVFGVNWVFERAGVKDREAVGDYQAGYITPKPSWPVAYAVAASSCFPPVFGPWIPPVKPDQLLDGKYPPGRERDKLVASIRLSDGGVYDNMGTEPVWKDHKVVLVSDGGAPFRFEASKAPLRRLKRYLSIVGNQSATLRKRWLISNFESHIMNGTYWGIGSDTASYRRDRPQANVFDGYSTDLVKNSISRIRTDMNRFTEAEIAVLENHGYLLAAAAHRCYLKDNGIVSNDERENIPYKAWMDEARVAEALKVSHKRLSFRRKGR